MDIKEKDGFIDYLKKKWNCFISNLLSRALIADNSLPNDKENENKKIKEAQEKLNNKPENESTVTRLGILIKEMSSLHAENAPIVSLDIGGSLIKCVCFVPDTVTTNTAFKISNEFAPFYAPHLSFSAPRIKGKFLFFIFPNTDFIKVTFDNNQNNNSNLGKSSTTLDIGSSILCEKIINSLLNEQQRESLEFDGSQKSKQRVKSGFKMGGIQHLIRFLQIHNFPWGNDKTLRCTGGGSIKYKSILLKNTKYETIHNVDEVRSLVKGLSFILDMHLEGETYSVGDKVVGISDEFKKDNNKNSEIKEKINEGKKVSSELCSPKLDSKTIQSTIKQNSLTLKEEDKLLISKNNINQENNELAIEIKHRHEVVKELKSNKKRKSNLRKKKSFMYILKQRITKVIGGVMKKKLLTPFSSKYIIANRNGLNKNCNEIKNTDEISSYVYSQITSINESDSEYSYYSNEELNKKENTNLIALKQKKRRKHRNHVKESEVDYEKNEIKKNVVFIDPRTGIEDDAKDFIFRKHMWKTSKNTFSEAALDIAKKNAKLFKSSDLEKDSNLNRILSEIALKEDKRISWPFILVQIGSGVSIILVNSRNDFKRVDGSGVGGATFLGLANLITHFRVAKEHPQTAFQEFLKMTLNGNSNKIDMVVSDIYGHRGYGNVGLQGDILAASFGKAMATVTEITSNKINDPFDEKSYKRKTFSPFEDMISKKKVIYIENKGTINNKPSSTSLAISTGSSESEYTESAISDMNEKVENTCSEEDIICALLKMIAINIAQIAYHSAKEYKITNLLFAGSFIQNHPVTQEMINFAINYFSGGKVKPIFVYHESIIGALGALIDLPFIQKYGNFPDIQVVNDSINQKKHTTANTINIISSYNSKDILKNTQIKNKLCSTNETRLLFPNDNIYNYDIVSTPLENSDAQIVSDISNISITMDNNNNIFNGNEISNLRKRNECNIVNTVQKDLNVGRNRIGVLTPPVKELKNEEVLDGPIIGEWNSLDVVESFLEPSEMCHINDDDVLGEPIRESESYLNLVNLIDSSNISISTNNNTNIINIINNNEKIMSSADNNESTTSKERKKCLDEKSEDSCSDVIF